MHLPRASLPRSTHGSATHAHGRTSAQVAQLRRRGAGVAPHQPCAAPVAMALRRLARPPGRRPSLSSISIYCLGPVPRTGGHNEGSALFHLLSNAVEPRQSHAWPSSMWTEATVHAAGTSTTSEGRPDVPGATTVRARQASRPCHARLCRRRSPCAGRPLSFCPLAFRTPRPRPRPASSDYSPAGVRERGSASTDRPSGPSTPSTIANPLAPLRRASAPRHARWTAPRPAPLMSSAHPPAPRTQRVAHTQGFWPQAPCAHHRDGADPA